MVKQYYFKSCGGCNVAIKTYINGEEESRDFISAKCLSDVLRNLTEKGYTFAYPDKEFEQIEAEYLYAKYQYEDACKKRMYRKEVTTDAENP